jgi:acyl dehydratase
MENRHPLFRKMLQETIMATTDNATTDTTTTVRYSMATAPECVGRELGVSDFVTIDQDRIDQFAACTGDHQWIHVDVDRARRESPFGGPIAHGYLTLSLVAAMVMEIGVIPPDAATGLNYGLDKVRFIAPVKAGARVRTRANLISAEPQGGRRMLLKLQCTLEIEGEAKPALVAEVLCMLLGKPEQAR